MRILSLTMMLAALVGMPMAIAGAQEYGDPSVATQLDIGGYYALPQPSVTAEAQPGQPGQPRTRPNGEASPSDVPMPRAPQPPIDPVQKGSIVDRLDSVQKQIDSLEQHVLSGSKCGCADTGCDQTAVYAGLEIVALKVFQSEGNYGENDYQPGVRFWAGYQRYDGLGVRIRWFDYSQSIGGELVDIENLDLELTDAFSLGHWDGIVSGGLRYTEFYGDAGAFGDDNVDSFATGLTVGVQLNRYLTDRASIFASLQESILYGNELTEPMDDIVFSMTEIQLGAQINRDYCGNTLFFRTGLEAQLYAAVSDEDSEDVGLFGFFATVGWMR